MAKQRSAGVQVQMNWIDRAIEYVSPVRAAQRLHARATLAVAGQWLGARTDRRETAGWLPFAGSADADSLLDLPTLRTRSRDLERGEPLAKGAINTVVTKTVATGLSLRSVIDRDRLRMSADQAEDWQQTTQGEFRLWAEDPVSCDLRGQLAFAGQQELALRSALGSGDVLALLPWRSRPPRPYHLKVQLIEADRVCNKDSAADTPRLAGGIARDGDGLPVAYHILRRHPGSLYGGASREWDVVPAFGSRSGRRNVVHLLEILRPEQSRGVPYLAPVIEQLKQLGKYTNAELQAAVVAALFTVFVKTQGGVGLGLGGEASPAATKSGDSVKLGSGAIIDLADGEDIVLADPKRPNTAFDGFVLAILRQIGVALELPFEILVKHFTASYTAARAALLECWNFIRKRREWLACGFCDPIYEAWMEEAVLRGRVSAPGFLDDQAIRAAYLGCEWVGDPPGLLDPLREVQAARERIDGRLSNHSIETMEMKGLEWKRVNEQLGAEMDQMKRQGTETGAPQDKPAPTEEPAGKEPADKPDKPDETEEERSDDE